MDSPPVEKINAKPWKHGKAPRRILIIRLQAIGDVVLTFPLVQALKNEYPGMEIDFLTRHTQHELCENLSALRKVISITNSQRTWRQVLDILLHLPMFMNRRYDIVIDLQRNKASRILSRLLQPAARSAFDRSGPLPAIERYRNAVEAAGLKVQPALPGILLTKPHTGEQLLRENGWDGQSEIVLLNPAGLFKSRNWPIENYVSFAKQWISISDKTQFLVMGDTRITSKTEYLKEHLGHRLIDLHQKTTLEQAFCILSKAQFMISEDSGLYWMAWVQKLPSIAMFGSTPGSRMNMGGNHARLLTSSDLPCGDCFLPDCKFGETAFCLSRYTPDSMLALAMEILKNNTLTTPLT